MARVSRAHDALTGDLFLGLDVGSSSTKAVLVDAGGGVVADARLEHGISRPRPGWAEQDAERDWWGDVVEACRRVLDGRAAQVGAVGVSGLGPCVLAAGADGAAAQACDPLRHRLARERSGRAAHRRVRRGRDPGPLRLSAVEPVGGTQDPLARGGGATGVVRDATRLRCDVLHRLAPHRRVRPRPSQRQPLGAALRRAPQRVDRRVEGAGRAGRACCRGWSGRRSSAGR